MRRFHRGSKSIIGVDFSGSEKAGESIWLAEASLTKNNLTIHRCQSAADLPGSARKRETALTQLVCWLMEQAPAAVGFDFPFSLPSALMPSSDWQTFVTTFGSMHTSPESFRSYCQERSPGKELRRRCDRDVLTPMSVYNLRLYKQTYFGIRDVLAALLRSKKFVAPPMMERNSNLGELWEICPASLLKAWKKRVPYKGKTALHRQQRQNLIRELKREGIVFSDTKIELACIDQTGGDALDSVLACWGTAAAYLQPIPTNLDPIYQTEGYIPVSLCLHPN